MITPTKVLVDGIIAAIGCLVTARETIVMQSRRVVLKKAFLSYVGGAVGNASLALAEDEAPAGLGSRTDLEVFLDLSRSLTGFDDLDEDLAGHFMSHLAARNPDTWPVLMSKARELQPSVVEEPSKTAADTLLSSERLWALAKEMTMLWYSGWTQPASEISQEVRADGYRKSLAWRAMKLRPRGVPTGGLWQDPAASRH